MNISSDGVAPGPDRHALEAAEALLARLAALDAEVAAAVARRGAAVADEPRDAPPGGQGLFISESDVARLLRAGGQRWNVATGVLLAGFLDDAHPRLPGDRLTRLGEVFGLPPADLAALLVAVAPDVEPRFEKLYAYLHDDVGRRRATIALFAELAGLPLVSADLRARFRPESPLIAHRLVTVEDPDQPFPSRVLRVPDRVVEYLLGCDLPDPAAAPLVLPPLAVPSADADLVGKALASGSRLFYMRASSGAGDHAAAAGALVAAGVPCVSFDLSRAPAGADPAEVAAAVAREAGLQEGGLVAGPVDGLVERDPRAVEALVRAPGPVVLLGSRAWEPAWTGAVPVIIDAVTTFADQAESWRASLDAGEGVPLDVLAATAAFRLGPHQVLRAAGAARAYAAARGEKLDAEAVRAGARAQNGGGLETLARRARPRATLDDLVLAPTVAAQVMEVVRRARLRNLVVGEWGMSGVGARGEGITALFAGPSGTGKTLAAEVVAGSLGLDLYVVDLASIVDKYVGETEKNLERIFSGAQGLNGVLFFDEADALFGKRSAVSDGHDRYANIEVAYLLQRMEQFDGVSVLATNLTANLDDAFARRIDVRVVFAVPEAPERRRLWARHLPPTLPVADDVDIEFLAGAFRLAGGDIRNIALAAAYEAAAEGVTVAMGHIVRATAREYRKLGRLCTEEDFGPWLEAVQVN